MPRKLIFPSILLFLLAVLPYCRLLKGESLFDDIQVIRNNRDLIAHGSFQEIFTFVMKPTRPVADLFLALGEWISPRLTFGQRALSLFLHALNTVLLWAVLLKINASLRNELPKLVLFSAAALFAVTPVQSEAVLIAQYRMDMLGVFFSLLACWCWFRKKEQEEKGESPLVWAIALFLSFGGAALSKEPYAVIAPCFVALVVWVTTNGKNPLELFLLTLCWPIFWWMVLLAKMRSDAASAYPFTDFLGYSIISPWQHFLLAGHALIEGFGKVLTGQQLTIVRLHDRINYEASAIGLRSVLALSCFLGFSVFLFFRDKWLRLSGGMLLLCILPYLLVPNLNIGSEHYWYFGSAAVWLTGAIFLWRFQKKFVARPAVWFAIFFISFGTAHLFNLEKRLSTMGTRLDFYLAELKSYPKVADRWIDLAASMVESPRKNLASLARRMLDEAIFLDPNHPLLPSNEYFYSVRMGNKEEARKKYQKLVQIYNTRPDDLLSFRAFWKANFGEEPS
jgi:hypothetical protein